MKEIIFEGKVYQISYEAMPDTLKEKLPGEELKTYLSLLQHAQIKPKEVYKEIKAFSEKYKSVPEVLNLLTFAHIQNHRVLEAEELIKKTYEENPDYLFAKINYADQCVRKKKLDKIPEIFPTFDLKELCPEKEIFHTSEFRGFLIMMAHYYRGLKNREKAIYYYETAKQIDPDHPGVAYLEKKLFRKPLLKRLLFLKK